MIDTEQQKSAAARFNALVQNLGDLVTLHNASGVILYATPSTARHLGYTEQELVGMNAFRLIHPDDLGTVRLAFARVLDSRNQGEPTEYRVGRSDGQWVDVETIGTNLLGDPAIGGIILTSRIITERKRHQRQLEAITAVASALRTASTRAELLPVILDQVIQVLSVQGAALILRGGVSDEPLLTLGRGRCETWTPTGSKAAGGVTRQVMQTGEVYRTNDLLSEALFAPGELLQPEQCSRVAAACLPLKAGEAVIGAIWIESCCDPDDRGCAITDEQVQVLKAIAEMSGHAIHRTTLSEQTELRLHRLTVLQVIDLTISRSVDLQLTLDLLLGEITSRLHIDAADVLVLDGARNELRRAASRGFTTDFLARSEAPSAQGVASRPLLDRRVVHVEGVTQLALPSELRPVMEAEGFQSYYGLPLVASGRVLGVLELFQRASLTNDREWIDYLDGLAAHVAFAVEKVSLIQDLRRSNEELRRAYDGVIESWSGAQAARGHEAPEQTRHLAEMAVRLGRLTGFPSSKLTQLRRGAMLHDVGNIAVPDTILLKADALSEQEWNIVRMHPRRAHALISAIPDLRDAADIPYCHHERWDGSGYPRRLKAHEIPLSAQIFSVVDVYDALTSERPYRKAWSAEKAIEFIRSQAGKSFNPAVVDTFLKNLASIVADER